jgi:hypothetical protein
MLNLNEAKQRIKKAGAANARAVPMKGQTIDGDHQIEILEGSQWVSIATGISRSMASNLIKEATNRVILG